MFVFQDYFPQIKITPKFLQNTYVKFNFIHITMSFYSFFTNNLFRLEGRLYSGNLTEVQREIESALDKTHSLIIDLDPLEKFDTAGAFMLYVTSEKAKENNKEIILYCQKNEKVKSVFSYAGIQFYNKLPVLNSNPLI